MQNSKDQENITMAQHNKSLTTTPMKELIEDLSNACEWFGYLETDWENNEFHHQTSEAQTAEEFNKEHLKTYNAFLKALDKLKEIHNVTN